ncbi:TrmH family RNA methyltransferase [Aldersonia kunmingensis]|uniref:TrmH family RNA methyltransferase n=1 Tax=Aldersonia kunmingensis TaxID=408066 RepID=UPI00082B172E|nr:RNA methyltransferase [Aldersonia kunmingensis]
MDVLTERTPRVVSAVKLHRGAQRRKTGTFLIEGANSLESALAGGHAVEVFCTDDARERFGRLLDEAAGAGVPVSLVTDRAARGLSDTVTPAGLVAVCRLLDVSIETALAGRPALVAVPVEIAEPGNAGTVIRVADAVGADAVVLAGDAVDPHNGKCVRASAGSVFHLPIARERSIDAALSALTDAGLQVLATAADGEVDLDDADELLRAPTAWLFGNEAHGLAADIAARADHRIRIPIRGRAESLNLATAAAICLYESARAHHRAGTGNAGESQ